jgi:hypothetical protein
MPEGSNYSTSSEECWRCLRKARSSKDYADQWAWLILTKSWLNLINIRLKYDHEPETFDPA